MAGERVVPGLGGLISAFWTHHSDGWHTKMDTNLRALASLTQLSVISRVTSVPGSPTDGDIHIVTAGGDENKVAVRDNGAWVYFTPVEGWAAWDRATDEPLRFDGSTWTIAAAGLVDAPADGSTYARKDNAWIDIDDAFDGVAEAPNDGDAYVRNSEAWELLEDALDDLDVVIDAPGDGTYYGRRNNAWTDLDARYVQDAPSDGDQYARKDGGWEVVAGGGGSSSMTVSADRTASFTLGLSDEDWLPCNHATVAIVVTIPPNSTVAFSVGTSKTIQQTGAALASFDEGAGVTFINADGYDPACRAEGSVLTATKVAADTWSIYGDAAES